jgi:hypothetical protein
LTDDSLSLLPISCLFYNSNYNKKCNQGKLVYYLTYFRSNTLRKTVLEAQSSGYCISGQEPVDGSISQQTHLARLKRREGGKLNRLQNKENGNLCMNKLIKEQ